MNTDGSEQTRLINNQAGDSFPCFSPDGSKIAYEEHWEICIMNVDGSEQTNIINNQAHDQTPSFSPDGLKIAFGSRRDENHDICIMNTDDSGVTNLTNNPAYDGTPAFHIRAYLSFLFCIYKLFCKSFR